MSYAMPTIEIVVGVASVSPVEAYPATFRAIGRMINETAAFAYDLIKSDLRPVGVLLRFRRQPF